MYTSKPGSSYELSTASSAATITNSNYSKQKASSDNDSTKANIDRRKRIVPYELPFGVRYKIDRETLCKGG